MIDRQLLRYPEQLASRLSQLERELQQAKNDIRELKKKVGNNG